VETSIAEQMRTSRGPVRDALLLLERDGLVVKLPNRGTRVSDFSERTLREAASLRAALEEFAVTLLVPRLHAHETRRLGMIVHRMEVAAGRRAAREFNEADYQFHDTIFESCGHRTLHEVWKGMQRRIRAFQASTNWVSGDLWAVAQRHRAVLRALESRKLSNVRRALRTHFEHLEKELGLLLAGQSGDGARRSTHDTLRRGV
jgi:DNA-binding GntR family transcriptional regulator